MRGRHRGEDPWNAHDIRIARQSIDFHVPPQAPLPTEGDEAGPSVTMPDDFYAHIFLEDVSNTVLPYGGRAANGKDVFTLASADDRSERMLVSALTYGGGIDLHHALSEAACDWGRWMIHSLLRHGRATFEVAPVLARDGAQVGFAVLDLNDLGLRRVGSKVVQLVPEGAWRRSDSPFKRDTVKRAYEVNLDDERIAEVCWPRPFEGVEGILPSLEILSAGRFPPFLVPNPHAPPETRLPFEFALFRRTEEVATAALTVTVGWDGRGAIAEQSSEYYLMVRRLRFERFKAVARACVREGLNSILDRVAPELGVHGRIVLNGLPTEADATAAEAELRTGTLNYTQVSKRFSIY